MKAKSNTLVVKKKAEKSFSEAVRIFVISIITLGAFELFNYSVTYYSLSDLLGSLSPIRGITWATILTVVFCGVDTICVFKVFSQDNESISGIEYLYGGWFLATALNTIIVWWGFKLAVYDRIYAGAIPAYFQIGDLTIDIGNILPVVLAVFIWWIRVFVVFSVSPFPDSQDQTPTQIEDPTGLQL